MVQMMKTANELWRYISRQGLKPLPKTSVSQWADTYRVLSSGISAEPGRWKTSRAPYQKEIMDAFTQPGIHRVVAKTASQIGKSDIMNNVIGRFAHLDPAAIMMIQPTIEMAQDYSKTRIAPMIRDTKVLSNLFFDVKAKERGNTGKTRDGNNTILSKIFPGGRLTMCGANSPAGLASRPVRILLADEVDRFPDSAGNEGDPVDLAAKRMTTFWNRVMGLFSTPTNTGASRIDQEYEAGTQEEWQYKCPNCGEFHTLRYQDMVTDEEHHDNGHGGTMFLVKQVRWRCPDCGFTFSERQIKDAPQQYIAQNPKAIENGIRSFYVNAFSSPWLSWPEIMKEWLEARGDPEREKVVKNTRFGESYTQVGNFDDEQVFLRRRETYGAELPDGVLVLTAAVDTQDNRLEYEVVGWGYGEERWGINKGVLLGVPDTKAVWNALDGVLDKTYHFADGRGMQITQTFIDSGGHYTSEVYAYCLANYHKRRFAIKGASNNADPLIAKYSKVQLHGRSIPLVLLGVDSGKQYIMDRLAMDTPGEKTMHFPLEHTDEKPTDNVQEIFFNRGYDEVYFKGLISEKLMPRKERGRIVYRWENIAKDKRNEPLDLAVYNLACVQSLKIDWDTLQHRVQHTTSTEKSVKTPYKEKKKRKYGCIKKGRTYVE